MRELCIAIAIEGLYQKTIEVGATWSRERFWILGKEIAAKMRAL